MLFVVETKSYGKFLFWKNWFVMLLSCLGAWSLHVYENVALLMICFVFATLRQHLLCSAFHVSYKIIMDVNYNNCHQTNVNPYMARVTCKIVLLMQIYFEKDIQIYDGPSVKEKILFKKNHHCIFGGIKYIQIYFHHHILGGENIFKYIFTTLFLGEKIYLNVFSPPYFWGREYI